MGGFFLFVFFRSVAFIIVNNSFKHILKMAVINKCVAVNNYRLLE